VRQSATENGTGAGSVSGLTIAAPNTTVRGLVINRFAGSAIIGVGADSAWVYGDYLGVDPTGTVANEGNGHGVFLSGEHQENVSNRLGRFKFRPSS
jgi:hypothetical protein